MNSLAPRHSSNVVRTRSNGGTARALAGFERDTALGLARIEHAAQIESAKAHAVGYVGQQGMQAVAMLSQMEGQLGQAVPMAVSRLQGIADMTALSIAQVVSDSARKIGR